MNAVDLMVELECNLICVQWMRYRCLVEIVRQIRSRYCCGQNLHRGRIELTRSNNSARKRLSGYGVVRSDSRGGELARSLRCGRHNRGVSEIIFVLTKTGIADKKER